MSVGAFGSHAFTVTESEIRTPTDFEFTEELDYEMQTRSGKKPATYVKGQKEINFQLTLHLDVRYLKTDIPTEISFWLKAMRSGSKERLYLGRHYWGSGNFIVVSVHPNSARYSGDGTLLSCDLELKLAEWVAEGSATSDTGSTTVAATDTAGTSKSTGSIKISAASIKAAQIKKAETTVTKSARSGISDTIKITYQSMRGSGTLTIGWKAPDGHTASRTLTENSTVTVVKGSTVVLSWKPSKTYYILKTSIDDPQPKDQNLGTLRFLASSNATVKAYWK